MPKDSSSESVLKIWQLRLISLTCTKIHFHSLIDWGRDATEDLNIPFVGPWRFCRSGKSPNEASWSDHILGRVPDWTFLQCRWDSYTIFPESDEDCGCIRSGIFISASFSDAPLTLADASKTIRSLWLLSTPWCGRYHIRPRGPEISEAARKRT